MAVVVTRDDGSESARPENRWRIVQFFVEAAIGVALVALLSTWLLQGSDCAFAVVDSQIAGDADRFATRFAAIHGSCADEDLSGALVANFVVVLGYAGLLGALLWRWWNASWDGEPGKSKIAGGWFAVIAAIAVALSAVGNLVTGLSLEITDGVADLSAASLVAAIGWGKWLLVGILGGATVLMTLSWCVRGTSAMLRVIRDTGDGALYVPPSIAWTPEGKRGFQGFGIALSGGGIRSAAFSLGALSALEDTEVRPGDKPEALLDQAHLLATVSGGGYTGTAWRVAAGDGTRSIVDGSYQRYIGDPNRLVPTAAQRAGLDVSETHGPSLAERLRERRSFLRNGRGGLALSIVRFVAQLVFHVSLLLWTVGLLAWLVGRFIGTWAITTPGVGIEYARLTQPAIYALIAFGLFAVLRLFTVPGKWRTGWDAMALFCGTVAVGLALVLVVVPWTVVELRSAIEDLLPGGAGPQSSVAVVLTGGLATTAWRVLQAPLRSRAPYLGGVLLALSLGLFAMVVAGESIDPPSGLFLFPDSWTTWFVFWILPYVVMLSALNPDLWSLHPIYASRLRGTFENRLVGSDWASFKKGEWPRLSEYSEALGPHPVICAAAAREDRANTGLSVVSMTFEPDYVTVHQGATDNSSSKSVAIATDGYEGIFTGRAGEDRMRSMIGMAALSAAAVAPSLGRASMGSTDSLLAALNLRLGAWLPNPDFPAGERRIGPHMINMFKELRGGFSLDSPNIYVTDGGHWENMALVELIRRKVGAIIVVDSSLNEPYTFSELLEGVELARVECGAVISIDPDSFEAMKPTNSVRPPKNWCTATIEYPADGENEEPLSGRLLYVKAQASDAMPLDILRYSKEDPNFPNYSTANQMLSDREFSHLAVLGRESMIRALEDFHQWLFEEYEPLATAFGETLAPARGQGEGLTSSATPVIDIVRSEAEADLAREAMMSPALVGATAGFNLPLKRNAPTGEDGGTTDQ